MKSGFFLVLVAVFWCTSCQWGKGNVTPDGFVALQPGYFCQLGAIAVVGDTIVLAGSYIPEENPNIPVQPVYSYLAAVGMDGKVYWEQTHEEADYVKWQFLVHLRNGDINAVGIEESPISGSATHIQQIDIQTGKLQLKHLITEEESPVIRDVVQNSNNEIVLLRTVSNDSIQCSSKHTIGADYVHKSTPDCRNGQIQEAKFTGEFPYHLEYLKAYGSTLMTTELFYFNQTQIPWQIPLPKEFGHALINNINQRDLDHILFVTTTKNAQGPCLWRSGTDSTWQHTCLDYWPFHGTAILRQHGNYTLMAFNAGNTDKPSTAHVVLFDGALQVVWQQDITPQTEAFIIKDMAVQQNNLVVAGTLETEGKGSRMAVKIIALPPATEAKN